MFMDNDLTEARPLTQLKVRLGEHNLVSLAEGSLTEKTIDVTKYTNHEDFAMPNNDIVMLELAEEADLTVYTPACMAKTSDTDTFDGKTALVYGEKSSHVFVSMLAVLKEIFVWYNAVMIAKSTKILKIFPHIVINADHLLLSLSSS